MKDAWISKIQIKRRGKKASEEKAEGKGNTHRLNDNL